MSVFGGDSWAREAQHRKRRIEDLVVEGIDGSSYKKLSNGKYACLICPNTPILDSPLMFSVHSKGSRHRIAESKLKERELNRQDEIKKRMALSGCSIGSTSIQKVGLSSKPLIEQTRKTASEILLNKSPQQSVVTERSAILSCGHFPNGPSNSIVNSSTYALEMPGKVVQQQFDFRERQERELKFTAAGWKRDGHGKWFRDENVEFDSDEEDPNVCLV